MSKDKRGWRPCVRVVVIKEGKLLLGKKLFGKQILWSVPGGGIEKGRTPEEACIEEALEEAGVMISDVTYLGITHKYDIELPQPERRRIYRGGEDSWYMARWVATDKSKYGSEGDEQKTKWVTLEEAKHLLNSSNNGEPEFIEVMIGAFEKALEMYKVKLKKNPNWR